MAFSIGVVAFFANIDAENTAVLDKLAARDVGEQGVYALVVKSHAVDDRLLFGNAKEPRFGVALLRTRGDGADFDKAKAHGGEYVDVLAIFCPIRRPDRRGWGRSSPSMNAVGCWPEFWVKAESVRRVREFE